ncbi:hypothetical protein L873DRAFT_1798799 [Choiromyces venosus 120613-1]|uniref:Uncharacterized protein n=1 Tax=Choiromyces venosus 120613-1 TaxID=1336337 RepID=A0A3N4K6U6_9PEZI|nr:hypothetical protein L873DRAFT_1798799 [Choiromyces venosus 120613-1]
MGNTCTSLNTHDQALEQMQQELDEVKVILRRLERYFVETGGAAVGPENNETVDSSSGRQGEREEEDAIRPVPVPVPPTSFNNTPTVSSRGSYQRGSRQRPVRQRGRNGRHRTLRPGEFETIELSRRSLERQAGRRG